MEIFKEITIPKTVLSDEYIIKLWKQGLTKYEVANTYFTNFNKYRSRESVKITKRQALAKVEKVLYDLVMSW